MALAKIKMTMPGITNVSGMAAKLFDLSGAIDAAAVVTGLTLTVDAVDTDTYWTEVDATSLSGVVYLIKALEGTTNHASGYVKITNTTNVHVVCDSPNLADIDGTTAVVKWGAITDRTANVDLSGTTILDVSTISATLGTMSAVLSSIATAISTVVGLLDNEIATLLARLGLFTGTGNNTVLGLLRAAMSKDAPTPSDVGGTFNATNDSLESVQESVAAIDPDVDEAAIAAAVDVVLTAAHGDGSWLSNASPTVVVSATSPQLQTIDEDQTITIHRGDYTQIGLTVGTVAGRTGEKLFFTIREEKPAEYDTDPLDAEALLQVTELTGALSVKEAAWATASDGSIVVDDEVTGDIRIILKSAITTLLPIVDSYWYDVQKIRADGDAETVAEGRLNITADVTRRSTVA